MRRPHARRRQKAKSSGHSTQCCRCTGRSLHPQECPSPSFRPSSRSSFPSHASCVFSSVTSPHPAAEQSRSARACDKTTPRGWSFLKNLTQARTAASSKPVPPRSPNDRRRCLRHVEPPTPAQFRGDLGSRADDRKGGQYLLGGAAHHAVGHELPVHCEGAARSRGPGNMKNT